MRYSPLLLLLACGGPPTPAPDTAQHPHEIRLVRPCDPTSTEEMEQRCRAEARFEPSGAAVLDGALWVASDKKGWVTRYALPLKAGANAPTLKFDKPGLHAIGTKFEAVTAVGSALLFLEAFGRTVWRCEKPALGCPQLVEVDVGKAIQTPYEAAPIGETGWVTFEALGWHDGKALVGIRSYRVEKDEDDVWWPHVYRPDGGTIYGGKPWMVDGKPFSLSDVAVDGDTLWMTWSHEAAGVAGLIARAELEKGLPGEPKLCTKVVGKPEGVAVWGENLIVVFDQDDARKGTPDGFPLAHNEDYAMVYPKKDCP